MVRRQAIAGHNRRCSDIDVRRRLRIPCMVKLRVQSGKQIAYCSDRVIDVAVMLSTETEKRLFHFLVVARHVAEFRAQK